MPGRQLNFSIRGEQYEKAFDAISSSILSVVRVPRAEDYGIDAFCDLRAPVDRISQTVTGTFGVQVRGPGGDIDFGGLSDSGAWKIYEIEWLRSLAIPLYLARVDEERCRVEFYSCWPIWIVLAESRAPFRIICECDDRADEQQSVRPRSKATTDTRYGDGMTWTVPLGPPFLSFSQNDLNEPDFARKASRLLLQWIGLDRATLLRFQLGVAYVEGIRNWFTNEFDAEVRVTKQFMSWSQVKGQNVDRIVGAIEPLLVNLGVHLQWQDDSNVYRLIPVFEWLASMAKLSTLGSGLLNGIRDAQQQGISPKPRPTAK